MNGTVLVVDVVAVDEEMDAILAMTTPTMTERVVKLDEVGDIALPKILIVGAGDEVAADAEPVDEVVVPSRII